MNHSETTLMTRHHQEIDFMPWDAPLWPKPWEYHAKLSGWDGLGLYWDTLPELRFALLFACLFFFARRAAVKFFPIIADACHIQFNSKRARRKFSYNMWLLFFYAASSAIGFFWVLRDAQYFSLPTNARTAENLVNHHPAPVETKVYVYYLYQLGFYIAELHAIFVESRRSDFTEYVVHHVLTICLITFSYIAREHRVGAVVVILHDIPDVLLCLAKFGVYIKQEALSTSAFALFTASFAYFRLFCLPMLTYAIVYLGPQVHVATASYWILVAMLGLGLQSLHLYWFALILKLIWRLVFAGYNKDPRSEDDEDEQQGNPSTSCTTT